MKLADRLDRMVHPINGIPELDNLIDSFFGPRNAGTRVYMPRTDIVENSTGFVLSVELPGVDAADVAVEVIDDRLIVSGEKKALEVDETSTVHRRERVVGKFERSFEFPTMVDFEKIEATSGNGVLTINVPKAEKVLPRKIEIAVK
jgi:HSP20 family protein